VITDKALFNFESTTHEMQLISLYPGITLAQVEDAIEWKIKQAETLIESAPPSAQELHTIRVELDPHGRNATSREA
jgi:glutaconate CoA-transferase subunit B